MLLTFKEPLEVPGRTEKASFLKMLEEKDTQNLKLGELFRL